MFDPAGAWHVEDVSRNGCELFDPDAGSRPAAPAASNITALHPLLATGPRALHRLSKGQALALPRQGALRLGPLPSDPLLHFVQLAQPASAELGPAARAGTAIAGSTRTATSATPSTANAELLLWCQPHPSAALSQWRFAGGSVSVGAADDAQVQIDQSHVSGQHLSLHCDPAGAWHVEDVSRNGSELFDPDTATRPAAPAASNVTALHPLLATGPRALQRLSKGQALALPRQGALRLGPLPSDPLLHFVQLASAAALPVQPAAPLRRATKIAV